MRLKVRNVGSSLVVIGIQGRFTVQADPSRLHRIVGQLLRAPASSIVLDLSRVDHLDCAGIGQLVQVFNNVRAGIGEVRMASLDELHLQMLEVLELHEVLPLFASVRDAVEDHERSRRPSRRARPARVRVERGAPERGIDRQPLAARSQQV